MYLLPDVEAHPIGRICAVCPVALILAIYCMRLTPANLLCLAPEELLSVQYLPSRSPYVLHYMPSLSPYVLQYMPCLSPYVLQYMPSRSSYLLQYMPSRSPYVVQYMPSRSPYVVQYMPSRSPFVVQYMPSRSPYVLYITPRSICLLTIYHGLLTKKTGTVCYNHRYIAVYHTNNKKFGQYTIVWL